MYLFRMSSVPDNMRRPSYGHHLTWDVKFWGCVVVSSRAWIKRKFQFAGKLHSEIQHKTVNYSAFNVETNDVNLCVI